MSTPADDTTSSGASSVTGSAAAPIPRLPDPAPAPAFPKLRRRVSPSVLVMVLGATVVAFTYYYVPTGLPTGKHVAVGFVMFLVADATVSVFRIGRVSQVRQWSPAVFAAAWVLVPGSWLLMPALAASAVLNFAKAFPRGVLVPSYVARRGLVISAAIGVAHVTTLALVHSPFLTEAGVRDSEGRIALAVGGLVGGLTIAATVRLVDRVLFGINAWLLQPDLARQLLRGSSVAAIGAVTAWVYTIDPWTLTLAVPVLLSYLWHLGATMNADYTAAWEAELLAARLVLDVSYPLEAVQAYATRRVLPYATHITVTPSDSRLTSWQIRKGHLVTADGDPGPRRTFDRVQGTAEDVATETTKRGMWVTLNFAATPENLTGGMFVTFFVPRDVLHRKRHALAMAQAAVGIGQRLSGVTEQTVNQVDPAIRLSVHRMLELLNRNSPADRANRREVLTELHRLELLVARRMGGSHDNGTEATDSIGFVSAGTWT